jgi:hypothetical protein
LIAGVLALDYVRFDGPAEVVSKFGREQAKECS